MTTTREQTQRLSLEEKRSLAARLMRAKQPPSRAAATHPLAAGQQALWVGQQQAPRSTLYNLGFATRVRSLLDVPTLRSSFQQLIDRHAALRSTVEVNDGIPSLRVHAQREVSFREVDCDALSEQQFDARLAEETQRPFDLSTGPLLRVLLFNRGAGGHVLLLTMHHLIGDYWSLANLLRELGILYTAGTTHASPLPPTDFQYADFVRWQAELLNRPEGARLRDFWQGEFAVAPTPLDLPLSRPRPPARTYNGGACLFSLDEKLTGRIKALARDEGATLYVVLLTAFQLLLHRYTGQSEITVGTPAAGRSRPEFTDVFGYFVNPVALRTDFAGDPSVRQALEQVRRRVLSALAHQDYPFSMLVQHLQPKRDASRTPVFQVMLTLEKSPWPECQGASLFVMGHAGARLNLGALELESIRLKPAAVEFDCTLMLEEVNGTLYGAWQYNSDLFDEVCIKRFDLHLRRLLEEMTVHPTRRVSELELLTDAEQHALLFEFNDTSPSNPPTPLLACLRTHLYARPDAVALACGDAQLTRA
ncbi:MAG: condensation domain-containing protein, partial [Pyrinomonadaceae bacterium]